MAKKKLSSNEAFLKLTKKEQELIRTYNDAMFFDKIKPTLDEDTTIAFNNYYKLQGLDIVLTLPKDRNPENNNN